MTRRLPPSQEGADGQDGTADADARSTETFRNTGTPFRRAAEDDRALPISREEARRCARDARERACAQLRWTAEESSDVRVVSSEGTGGAEDAAGGSR